MVCQEHREGVYVSVCGRVSNVPDNIIDKMGLL